MLLASTAVPGLVSYSQAVRAQCPSQPLPLPGAWPLTSRLPQSSSSHLSTELSSSSLGSSQWLGEAGDIAGAGTLSASAGQWERSQPRQGPEEAPRVPLSISIVKAQLRALTLD